MKPNRTNDDYAQQVYNEIGQVEGNQDTIVKKIVLMKRVSLIFSILTLSGSLTIMGHAIVKKQSYDHTFTALMEDVNQQQETYHELQEQYNFLMDDLDGKTNENSIANAELENLKNAITKHEVDQYQYHNRTEYMEHLADSAKTDISTYIEDSRRSAQSILNVTYVVPESKEEYSMIDSLVTGALTAALGGSATAEAASGAIYQGIVQGDSVGNIAANAWTVSIAEVPNDLLGMALSKTFGGVASVVSDVATIVGAGNEAANQVINLAEYDFNAKCYLIAEIITKDNPTKQEIIDIYQITDFMCSTIKDEDGLDNAKWIAFNHAIGEVYNAMVELENFNALYLQNVEE
ncbi:MAG: hypothetical protein R3Y54_06125 [Eubacteriales bacterium]